MSLVLSVLQNSEMYQCLAREGWTRTIETEMRHQISYCMQCQGWIMRTSISSTDSCMTFLCVEETILLSFIRMSALCIAIFYRSSRFVKSDEDIWLLGFTSLQTQVINFSLLLLYWAWMFCSGKASRILEIKCFVWCFIPLKLVNPDSLSLLP